MTLVTKLRSTVKHHRTISIIFRAGKSSQKDVLEGDQMDKCY